MCKYDFSCSKGYYPWARMLSSPLRSVICVRLSERQDLLLADNFTRQIESGIGSFQILFIDNWAKTNPLLLLINYSGTYKNKIARVSVSVWNECCDPPLLPVATPSLQLQDRWNVQRLTQSCIQYLHNFTLSQHELRFILSALKAPHCSLCTLYHRHQYLFMFMLTITASV